MNLADTELKIHLGLIQSSPILFSIKTVLHLFPNTVNLNDTYRRTTIFNEFK